MQESALSNKLNAAAPSPAVSTGDDDLVRIFNTALVASQAAQAARNFSGELLSLTQSAAFRAILSAVRQLATSQNTSEAQAAEALVTTFRQLDSVWRDYVLQEGIARIKGQPV